VARIREPGDPLREAVARQVELYPPFAARGWTHLHDPLAAVAVVRPDLVDFVPVHVDVETGGRHGAGQTLMREPTADVPANARVALGVRAEAAEQFILDRIAGPKPG
jgi:purine nucleosidase